MKKIFFILFIFCCASASFAQFNNQVTQSNPTTLIVFQGGVTGARSVIMPNVDTLNNVATPYAGALTRRPQDGVLYMSDGVNWHPFFGAGNPFRDTIYTAIPLYVDTSTVPGRQIIRILHDDGLISGGIVTWSGQGLIFDVTTANYFKNYISYTSPSMQVTLAASNPSLPRTDLFVVDTFALADKITGTAAANPVVPQINPTSQLPLTSITLNAGDTVPSNIDVNVIYNEDLQYPTEWDTSRSGTINVDFENTDNPYNGSKAAFVSTYSSGGSLIFTDGEEDTLRNGDILKAFVYLNGAFSNYFQLQFFNGSTAVSNKGSLQSGYGLNPLDSGQYQNVSIPLSVFTFSSNYYDRVVITMQGYDTSGAKGFYIDYVQIQSGLINPDIDLTNKVDSVNKNGTSDTLFYWIKGIPHFAGTTGSAGGGAVNNVGNGYRLVTTNGTEIKTVSTNLTLTIDSTSNANQLTWKVDTAQIATQYDLTQITSGINALTGDVTASGTGSVAATLATVNSNVGTFTNATVTVNGKGLITAASSGTPGAAADQQIQATDEQTAFTFSGVPSSYNSFWIDINGGTINQYLYYTKVGNVITFSSGVMLGSYVTLHFK